MITSKIRQSKIKRSSHLATTGTVTSGYDSVKTSKRRKVPTGRVKSENHVLKMPDRQKMSESTSDLYRNFSTAAWCVRKHLDFVTRFAFEARTGNDDLDKQVDAIISRRMMPAGCHSRGLHRFGRLLRIWESQRVMNGDCGVFRLRDGTLQTIEHDRIRNPSRLDVSNLEGWDLGVKTSGRGRHLAYAVHKRTQRGGYEFERTVRGSDLHLFGYFFREDQDRGVSPLSSAINSFRDAYEGLDYTLARMKVSQLFGLAIYSEDNDAAELSLDFAAGPQLLRLGDADKAEFLESKQPSFELQQFFGISIGIALKALDIPYSFYDEAYTNFFGSKAALMQYLQSAAEKREDVKELLRWVTTFWLALAVVDGELTLPAGMSVSDIAYEWIPRGLPWWDMMRDITAINKAIENQIMTRTQVRREFFADNWEQDVMPQWSREQELIDAATLGSQEQSQPMSTADLSAQIDDLRELIEMGPDQRGEHSA